MVKHLRSQLRVLMVIAFVAALASGSRPAVSGADNTVTLWIQESGTVTAELIEASMDAIGFSPDDQSNPGLLRLRVSDLRGTAAGWCVSIVSSVFSYEGESAIGGDIPAAAFHIEGAAAPLVVAGQPLVADGPDFDPLSGASLDASRAVIWANPGSGSGDYEQVIKVIWQVPGNAQSGAYSGILTITASSAP